MVNEWTQIILLLPFSLLFIILAQWSLLAGGCCAVCFIGGFYLSNRVILDSPSFMDFSFSLRKAFLKKNPCLSVQNEEEDEASSGENKNSSSCIHHVNVNSIRPRNCSICETENCARDKTTVSKLPPWVGENIPKCVDSALLEFIEITLKTYVHNWYLTEISEDESFLLEIRYQIRYVIASLYKRINDVDLTDFIFDKVVPVATSHAAMYANVKRHFGQNATPEMLEQRFLDFLRPAGGLHKAMYSRNAELAYLRSLADYAITELADEYRLTGDIKRPGDASNRKIIDVFWLILQMKGSRDGTGTRNRTFRAPVPVPVSVSYLH